MPDRGAHWRTELSLLVQTLNNFMQIKVKALGHRNNNNNNVFLPADTKSTVQTLFLHNAG